MGFRLKDTMKLKKVLKPIIALNTKNSVTHEEFIDTCANNDGDERRQPALRRLALNDVVNSLKKGRLGDQTKNLVTMYTPVSIQTLQFAATKHPSHSPTKRSIKNNSNTVSEVSVEYIEKIRPDLRTFLIYIGGKYLLFIQDIPISVDE
ncbi:hypothetical protein Tco_0693728 [Tanacetum coccineum]